jgi:REP element-mobilizing transposase RayT
MIKNKPDVPHHRSIRLKGYDYSQKGYYFVTICTQNKICLFGQVENDEIQLNDAGRMIVHWYLELESKFPEIRCDAFVCMPNHIHFIVQIAPPNTDPDTARKTGRAHLNGQTHRSAPTATDGDVVQWFKTGYFKIPAT